MYIQDGYIFYFLNCSCQFMITNAVDRLNMWTLISLRAYDLVRLYLTAEMKPQSPLKFIEGY